MSDPTISIIMPTYNRALYIKDTIESIRRQTYAAWELIIMDDGSDDDTESIIRRFRDDRIKFYNTGRTGQVSRLKNEAIRKAAGELIAFNDSDDLWEESKLQKQVAALHRYPEAGFCLTGGYNFRKEGEPLEYFYREKNGERFGNVFIPLFNSEIAALTPTLLVKKKCIDLAGYFDETTAFSDTRFIASLACHSNAVILFEPLFFRRLHDNNDSTRHWELRYTEWVKVIDFYREKGQLPVKAANNARFRTYINFGEKCLLYRQNTKAAHQFFHAWQNKPFSIVPLKKIVKAIIRRYN